MHKCFMYIFIDKKNNKPLQYPKRSANITEEQQRRKPLRWYIHEITIYSSCRRQQQRQQLLRNVTASVLDERTEEAGVLGDSDGQHHHENDAQHAVAEGQPVCDECVVEDPAHVLGLVHATDAVLYRVTACAHCFEGVAGHEHRQQECRGVEGHEDNDGVGNPTTGPFNELGEGLTNCGHGALPLKIQRRL